MAILELARLGRLVLAQEKAFSQIWIYRSALDVPASMVTETSDLPAADEPVQSPEES